MVRPGPANQRERIKWDCKFTSLVGVELHSKFTKSVELMRYKYDFASLHFDKNDIFNRLISNINKSNSESTTNIKYKKK